MGFAVLALLADRHAARFRRTWLGARGELAQLRLGATDIVLLRPLTYMNLSGEAVRPLLVGATRGRNPRGASAERFSPGDIVLVYDDMDLPVGRLRLRRGGSAGGHRGVASVLAAAGQDGVARVRVGIGRPDEGQDAAEYVLSEIPPVQRAGWDDTLRRAADAVEAICLEGLEAAMARFNPH